MSFSSWETLNPGKPRKTSGEMWGENWLKWLGKFQYLPTQGLEVGSYEGESATWFLANILTHTESKLTCVDPWCGGEDLPECNDDSLLNKFKSVVDPWKDKVHTVRMHSQYALRHGDPYYYDFAYIDGSHTAPTVLSDSVLCFTLVKRGGIIIWDDYGWNCNPDRLMTPKPAIDAFLDCYTGKYRLIHKEWQVAIEKL